MRESDGPNSNVVGEKLCKHKYSSYPYCYGEIASETQGNRYFFVSNITRIKFQSYLDHRVSIKRIVFHINISILTGYIEK